MTIRYRSFFTAPVFLSFLFLSALLGTAVYLLYKSRQGAIGERQEAVGNGQWAKDKAEKGVPIAYRLSPIAYYRLMAFGILWFFITLSVESSIIPIVDVIYEHRVYLPSVGAFIAIVTALFVVAARVSLKSPQANRVITASLALIIVVLTGVTYSRNMVWETPISLWEDVVRKSPNKARGYNNLCNAYYRAKQIDEAIDTCGKALAINPRYADAYYNIGSALIKKNRFADAIEACNKAIALDPGYAAAYDKLGIAYAGLNQLDRAIVEFNKAIAINANYASAYHDLGIVYARANQIDRAIAQFSKAISVDPDYTDAYKNRGIAYFQMGNVRDAVPDLQRSCDMGDSDGCEYLKRAFNR